MKINVLIKRLSDSKVVETIGPCTGGMRGAEQTERGVNINLGEDYYTEIEEIED